MSHMSHHNACEVNTLQPNPSDLICRKYENMKKYTHNYYVPLPHTGDFGARGHSCTHCYAIALAQ